MEEELEFELFKRDKGNLRLTAGGVIMAQEFQKANRIIRDAIMRVGLVSEGLEGEISIGYAYGMNTDLFVYPPTMEFAKEYPLIKVTMESAPLSGLRKKLSSGELDIIFTFHFELPALPNTLHMKCHAVQAIVAMSSSHPLANKENLTFHDFSGQTFLILGQEESLFAHSDMKDILDKLEANDIKVRTMNGVESMLFGVRSGVGVAFLDLSLDIVHDNRYSYFLVPENHSSSVMHLVSVWKKDNLNPIVPIYLETLKENLDIDEIIG